MIEDNKKVKISTTDSSSLNFLYGTSLGRIFLKILINPFFSKIIGYIMDSRISVLFIKHYIKKNNIDISQYEDKKYKSYNDFFTRKVKDGKRSIIYDKKVLISPCDSKLTIYEINKDSSFKIKDSYYRVEDLLDSKELAKKYNNGYCLIFRLSVDDYHRYCYIDNGSKEKNIYIKGVLHTVRPIALNKYNIYKQNSREYSILKTENFGNVIQIEVGAMMVGRIDNYHQNYNFSKGEEKGKFLFGGSTIVLLLEKNRVKIDQEILNNTDSGYETIVKFGDRIGIKKGK